MKNLKLLIRNIFNLNPKSTFGKTNIIAFLTTILAYVPMVYCVMPLREEHPLAWIFSLVFLLCTFPVMLFFTEIVMVGTIVISDQEYLDEGFSKQSWKNVFLLLGTGIKKGWEDFLAPHLDVRGMLTKIKNHPWVSLSLLILIFGIVILPTGIGYQIVRTILAFIGVQIVMYYMKQKN